MEKADFLTSEDSCAYSTADYVIAVVAFIGLPLMAVALYKIYVDHQHNQAKEQAHRKVLDEYQRSKSGLAAKLQHEVIWTRTDSEMQRMRLEDNERTLRQRHKQEMREQETKHHEREQELEARMREIERQRKEQIEREKYNQEHISKLQEDVERKTQELELMLVKHSQERQEQAKAYEELTTKSCALRDKNMQIEGELQNQREVNEQLQETLKWLQDELRKRTEEPKKGFLSKLFGLTQSQAATPQVEGVSTVEQSSQK